MAAPVLVMVVVVMMVVGGGGVVGGELVVGAPMEPDATGAAGGGWGGVTSARPIRRSCISLLAAAPWVTAETWEYTPRCIWWPWPSCPRKT